MESHESTILLQAVAGVARAVRSLYGPNKLRKQVTDELDQTLFTADTATVTSALQSQNAGTAILQKALDEQQRFFGTSCATMVTLCGVLAEAVMELQRQGLKTNVIQQALSLVMTCCFKTAKYMRVPIIEAISLFQGLTWTQQLEALAQILSTKSSAANLAVNAASILDPNLFASDELTSLSDLVTIHVVRGGVTSATSSRVFDGLLLPIADTCLRTALSHKFASSVNITFDRGVVILAGDLNTIVFPTNHSVQVIFVHGEIRPRTIDAFVSCRDAPLCIPVASYESLRQLAELSGAQIVDSWDELLPHAIGHACIEVKLHEFSVSRVHDEDKDAFATLYVQVLRCDATRQPHASIIVQGPIKSLAEELRTETFTILNRLRCALRSKCVLSGNGSFWCACAAAVKLEAERLSSSNCELLGMVVAHLSDPLIQLGVILLENATGESYFARLARVRKVQQCFVRCVQDVGATKFYSCYYDFRNTKYAVLLPTMTDPESEDDRILHVDEYRSIRSAIQRGFRVIQIVLNIDCHHVS